MSSFRSELTRNPLQEQDPLKLLGPHVPSLVHEYCTLEDNINLCVVRKAPSNYKSLYDASETALEEDIGGFVINVYSKYKSDPDLSQEMIRLFFQPASEVKRAQFFNSVQAFCQITDKGFKAIAESPNMKGLSTLVIRMCTHLTDKGIKAIAKSSSMAGLRILILSQCNKLSDKGVNAIAKSGHLEKLKVLMFNRCSKLSDQGVRAIAGSRKMAGLATLRLSWCTLLTDEAPRALTKSEYLHLKNLDFSGCLITDDGVEAVALATNMIDLQTFNLNKCVMVTDRAIRTIITSPCLKKLLKLGLTDNDLTKETRVQVHAMLKQNKQSRVEVN